MSKHSSGSHETSSSSGGEQSKGSSEAGKTSSAPAEFSLNSEKSSTETSKSSEVSAVTSPESYNLTSAEKTSVAPNKVDEGYSLSGGPKLESANGAASVEQKKTAAETENGSSNESGAATSVEGIKPAEGEKTKVEAAKINDAAKEVKPSTEVADGVMPENMEAGDRFKLEAIQEENERIQKHFDEFVEKRYAETGELETKKELLNNCRELSAEMYDNAGKFSAEDPMLKNFSDHRYDRHVQQVIEKSLQSADQATELAKQDPDGFGKVYSTSISENTLIAAAAMHDVGMDGGLGRNGGDALAEYQAKAAENPKIGLEIRSGHSLESAKFILENREKFEAMNADIEKAAQEAGTKPDLINVDEAALLAAMHSRNAEQKPGVKAADLSSPEQVTKFAASLKELDSTYDDSFLYRTDENGKPMLDENGQRIVDEETVKRITTEAAALRHGDSFRPSSDVQITQAGEGVFIDASNVDEKTRKWETEMDGVKIYHTDENGKAIPEATLEEDDPEARKSKMYAVGEKNMRDIEVGKVDESNTCYFDVYLRDGNFCPHATAENITQRFGETNSVTSDPAIAEKFCYRIHSDVPMENESKKKMERIFDKSFSSDTHLKYEFVND